MFKWPKPPSSCSPEHELADYAELVCWKEKLISMTGLSKRLGRLGENDYTDGVPEEEETDEVVKAAYMEIERRREACRNGYPFDITRQGHTLHANLDSKNRGHIIYKYLLLATRLNMKNNRYHADIDGTLLFEELAAEAAREYLGNRAESLVFGTGAGPTDFPGKVNALCKKLREGDGFKNPDEAPPNEKDGKLDIVTWKHFTDGLPGKLIGFGQCKTGTNYKDTLTQLQPDSFCKKWMKSALILTPERMFFISEALSRSRWNTASFDAGVMFDRCRIIDFCDNISSDVLQKVTTWTKAAADATGLPC